MDFLERILASKSARTGARESRAALCRPAEPRRDFAAAIGQGPGLKIIAEMKRASPSRGLIREDYDPAAIARAYEKAGADALSVLTEPDFFSGSLDHLREARQASSLPILRKDFITEDWEIEESASCCDAVLLIVAAVGPDRLGTLLSLAGSAGLAALVEVHDEPELATALSAGARLIGVNNRDLTTFSVDIETTMRLRPAIPAGCTVVSESGLSKPEHLRALVEMRVHAALIGEAFMRSPDPGEPLRALRESLS
jgi:indole-3-glycerol phosphate synthase